MRKRIIVQLMLALLVAVLVVGLMGCAPDPQSRRGGRAGGAGSDLTAAALATYVEPGDLAE